MAPVRLRGMIPLTLTGITEALRASWAADTCSPDDLARGGWTSDNPSMGHCDITALVVHDFFGGELMVGEVHLDGDQQGHHWWNRFPSGIEVDLTREQFRLGQVVAEGRAVQRPQAGRLRAGMSTSCCVTGTGAGSADIPAGDRGALTRRRL
ncbi:hypothetical protein SRIMHP_16990 [Streptomyces rimosus subsp. rimosus]|uniref:Uncharacterized protein n=2 Tax=Streptomyces TaxID=1883 RepID=A0ABY3Z2M9_STRRM|nr:hypothetical protein SRIMR7_19510 [Streptomyces rimosus subsp. rimosus]UTH95826.1 hypothetical protein SRIMHP_16990 [Streptomyces rimosus subsp. rimosus]UTJ13923.1 hypothetical protein SRIMDV3_16885 [Streptomyces rimosus subsp. rimosus]